MTHQTAGALLGLIAAAGMLLVASWARARRPAKVGRRIAPFVAALSARSQTRALPPPSARSILGSLTGPGSGFRFRGRTRPPSPVAAMDAPLRKLTWIAVGGALGCVAGVALGKGSPSPLAALLLGVFGAAGGYLVLDRVQVQQVRRRRALIDQQLPAIVELLAFAVAAGETPLAALDRVASTTYGDLSDEVRRCVGDVRSGTPVDAALGSMSERVGSAALSRFVETLQVALDRGTPLAEVLRAQAADCRADERRMLLELAGRKDVLMLVPVVFLILPTVVLVALFPGVQSLRMVMA